MTRRTLTLLLASLLALGLTAAAAVAQVPYVALGPGPTYNTLGSEEGRPVIVIAGRRTYPTTGHINLTTVSVLPHLTLLQAVEGWFDGDLAVVPRDLVYPPGKSDAQVDAQNTAQMLQSQSAATTAALRELGLPVDVVVRSVTSGSPAEGRLQPGDTITSVDGTAVGSADELRARISAMRPGQAVVIGYRRDGRPGTVRLVTVNGGTPGSPRAVIGVVPQDRARPPLQVDINLMDVGGPSAGLTFALGIVDKLTPVDLAGGRFVAGTGEIQPDGTVLPIGGIVQKLKGARRAGATLFLVPAQNCAEAQSRIPAGLQLAKVSSLRDALVVLREARDGQPVLGCDGREHVVPPVARAASS